MTRFAPALIAGCVLCFGTAHADGTLALQADCDSLVVELVVAGSHRFAVEEAAEGDTNVVASIVDVTLKDGRGAVPVKRVVEDGELRVAAGRTVAGSLTLRYRVKSIALADEGSIWGVRHDASSIGGPGRHFLLLPDGHERLAVSWKAPPKCRAGGHGHASVTAGNADELAMALYLFGSAKVETSGPITAYWFGATKIDTAAATRFAAAADKVERDMWKAAEAPYALVMRVTPQQGDRSNGTGLPNTFLGAIGPDIEWGPRMRTNIAHEMLHRWLGLGLRLENDGYWFNEGFTTYFDELLLWRAKLVTLDEFIATENKIADVHFSNPHKNATNAEIRAGFEKDVDLSRVPYTRGALYAAELDAALRAKKSSLEAFVVALGHGELAVATFESALKKALGRDGVARYHAVIDRGAEPNPPSDVFGPCVERVAAKVGFRWRARAGVKDCSGTER